MIDRLARTLVWLAGGALVVMAFVITAEVLLRKYAAYSIGGVDEMTAYVFAITSTFAFGWATLTRVHIRIDVLRNVLPRPLRAAADVLAAVVFLVVFALIAERAVALAIESWQADARSVTPLRVPLAIPQALWAFGLVFTAVCAAALLWRAVRLRSAAALAPTDEVERELEEVRAAERALRHEGARP